MTAIIIQARMGSTRLFGKIMKNLMGKPVLWHIVNRCLQSKIADKVVVAITDAPEDQIVENFCKENKFLYYRGSIDNVLDRYYQAAKLIGADTVLRVTSDCPLIDPAIIDMCIQKFRQVGCDYISNVVLGELTFPLGLDVEVFSFKALESAWQNATEPYEKEHVTSYIWENKKREFVIGPMVTAVPTYARRYRLTVDYPEDFQLMEKIYQQFYQPGKIVDVREILKWLDVNPRIAKINAHCKQKQFK